MPQATGKEPVSFYIFKPMQITPQRIEEIYQEMLNRAHQRGNDTTSWGQYEKHKMEALAEVWKKFAQAGDNPVALAEAKRFEADTIHDLELKNINNLSMGGASQFTINQQRKETEQRYGMSLAQIQNMRAQISSSGENSSGPKFGEEGWWKGFNDYIKGLIGQGPRTGTPDGIPAEGAGQNRSRISMDGGYWVSLFYGMFNTVRDGQGNYLSYPELIPGIPETGLNPQLGNSVVLLPNLGIDPGPFINNFFNNPTGTNQSQKDQWEQQKINNNSNFSIGSSS